MIPTKMYSFVFCFALLTEGMESWDQEMLEDVVKKKHGASNETKTDIVSYLFHYYLLRQETLASL